MDLALPRGCARFDERWADQLLAAGLDAPETLLRPRPEGPGTGRGPRAMVDLPGGGRVFVKQALRGGLPARITRDRHLWRRRFLRDLDRARRAAACGCPVVPWLGAVFERARPGWRVFLIAPWIEGGIDLARLMGRTRDPREAEAIWRAALDAVGAMHRGGMYHRDLNLGNLVARRSASGWEVVVVDLDRPRLYAGPVPRRRRRRALARLARSWRRLFGDVPPPGGLPLEDRAGRHGAAFCAP
ncbi:MAG: hypothetical protein D6718_08795 [Acidobacteria bacterium]|nr:MAG: hypothetical protein D6718_08795 [Acidobacteriota bacterium]